MIRICKKTVVFYTVIPDLHVPIYNKSVSFFNNFLSVSAGHRKCEVIVNISKVEPFLYILHMEVIMHTTVVEGI